jgi:hypothetical protein
VKGHENLEVIPRKIPAENSWPPVLCEVRTGSMRLSKGTRTGKAVPIMIPVVETWPPILTEV